MGISTEAVTFSIIMTADILLWECPRGTKAKLWYCDCHCLLYICKVRSEASCAKVLFRIVVAFSQNLTTQTQCFRFLVSSFREVFNMNTLRDNKYICKEIYIYIKWFNRINICDTLTRCGILTPSGVMDLCHHWIS